MAPLKRHMAEKDSVSLAPLLASHTICEHACPDNWVRFGSLCDSCFSFACLMQDIKEKFIILKLIVVFAAKP